MYNHVPTIFNHEPSAQEVFDAAVRHLARQKRKSIKFSDDFKDTYCVYRHPEGYACVVGHFIPNEAYNPRMEANDAEIIVEKFGHKLPEWMSKHVFLLLHLQNAHDISKTLEELKQQLRSIAKDHLISDKLVDEIKIFDFVE